MAAGTTAAGTIAVAMTAAVWPVAPISNFASTRFPAERLDCSFNMNVVSWLVLVAVPFIDAVSTGTSASSSSGPAAPGISVPLDLPDLEAIPGLDALDLSQSGVDQVAIPFIDVVGTGASASSSSGPSNVLAASSSQTEHVETPIAASPTPEAFSHPDPARVSGSLPNDRAGDAEHFPDYIEDGVDEDTRQRHLQCTTYT